MTTQAFTTNWGRWGSEDQRGALNLITDETVLAAAKHIRRGRVYSLGIPIERHGMPNFDETRGVPMRLTLSDHSDRFGLEGMDVPDGLGGNEDMLIMASHTATHLDALCHVFSEYKLYNGFPHDVMSSRKGASKLGIEHVGAIAGRGVLLDVAGYLGVDCLAPGRIISDVELQACAQAQGTELQSGDLVLIRTGWLQGYRVGNAELWTQPGIGLAAARWLADNDAALIGADNSGVESMPFDGDELLAVHVECLVRRGIYLLETLDLSELAADRCYEFLLVVPPLKIKGGTGSPVNPIALA